MTPVVSSNLSAIGYDAQTKILRVRFKSGGLYEYQNVSPELHSALMRAESKGGFLAKHVKSIGHPCRKVPCQTR